MKLVTISLSMSSSFGINLLSCFVNFNFDFLFRFPAAVFFHLQFFLIKLLCLHELLPFTALQTYVQPDFIFIQKVIFNNRFSFHKIIFEFNLHLGQPMKYFYLIPTINIFASVHLGVLRTNIMDFVSY